ncbi:MAG: thioredoxin domain-containing protein [Spirochaetales bacterium]|nr:thioredoxin domain-containing protein [Spirochaetales bacterium]
MTKTIRITLMISLFLLAAPLFSNTSNYSDKNQLKGSSSPYLLQHADNPVHWLPWGDEAFAEARRLDRPILVSIGYSTCHWCHVMEHESFEDPNTASIMNNYLITIKVDREQLPGVDAFYMEAASLMGGSTGWPLNVFIDHEGKPFYAGTYFPTANWQNLIRRVDELWTTQRDKLYESGDALTNAIQTSSSRSAGSLSLLDFTAENGKLVTADYLSSLISRFDKEYPGFPSPQDPQFPPTSSLSFLLEYPDVRGRDMAEQILETMQNSGLHDRVGGGFHRYTTDLAWRIPHFEKMLYDNAQLMALYSRASVIFDRSDFLQTAIDIGDYLIRDMKVFNSNGQFSGFATAEDADDPEGEGAFYAWSPEEIKRLLPGDIAEQLINYWDIKAFNGERTHEPVTGWIPYSLGSVEMNNAVPDRSLYRNILLNSRNKRPRPGRDYKVLTDLNGLVLEGFSMLARVSGEPRFISEVNNLSTFLVNRYKSEGVVRSSGIAPYITDYAYMITGFTAAYPVLEDPLLIELAEKISAKAVEDLSTGLGSFYSNPKGSLNLPVRKVDSFDTQVPSGLNSLALGFARLYGITGNESYKTRVDKILESQKKLMLSYPGAYSTLLRANLLLNKEWHIVLAGNSNLQVYDQLKNKLLSTLGSDYLIITAKGNGNEFWSLLEGRKELSEPQVLICNDSSCLLPVYSIAELEQRLVEAGILP